MELTRRDFLRASSALAAAWGVNVPEAWAATSAAPPVVWLQAQSCSGCSVSLLNTIYYMTVDKLLLGTIKLNYHSTLMAASGAGASAAAQAALGTSGYVLVVEGAIPTGASGKYCYLWPGLTALKGVQDFAAKAGSILAVGTCAAYGGVVGAKPNPTGTKPLSTILSGKKVINIPGCPSHPDWIVGTIAYLIKYGKAPPLDGSGRPLSYFPTSVHKQCPYRDDFDDGEGEGRCQFRRGCKGPIAAGDCPTRKWNSGSAKAFGVNWMHRRGKAQRKPMPWMHRSWFSRRHVAFLSGIEGSRRRRRRRG